MVTRGLGRGFGFFVGRAGGGRICERHWPRDFTHCLFGFKLQSPVIVNPRQEYVVFSFSFNGFFIIKSKLFTDKSSFPFLIILIRGREDIFKSKE